MTRTKEHSLESLGIPCLAARRIPLKSGNGIRCYIVAGKTVWDPIKKRPKPESSKSVGIVENNAEFGRIVFKDWFLEQYPHLRDVTVIRKNTHEYVYLKVPPKNDTQAVGYLKRGKKRFTPTEVTSKVRHCGATLFAMLAAKESDYNLLPALKMAAGNKDASAIFAIANAKAQEKGMADHLIEAHAENYWYGSDTSALSSAAITQLSKRITDRNVTDKFTKAMLQHHCGSSGTEINFFDMDSTSVSTSASNEWFDFGHNKEHDPCKQLNIMFLTDHETGIAYYFRPITGNVNDVSAYEFDANKLAQYFRHAKHIADPDDTGLSMVHVFDRGFVSAKNFAISLKLGFDFVCCMPNSHKYVKEARAYAAAHNLISASTLGDELDISFISHIAVPEALCPTITNTETSQQKRLYLHVYFDYKRYEERITELRKICEKILAARKSNTYEKLSNKLISIDQEYALVTKIKNSDGSEKWRVNLKGLLQAAEFSATRVLATTLKDLSGVQAHTAYKNRVRVEWAINAFKTVGGRRLRTGNDSTMIGRLFILSYSGNLLQAMRHRAKKAAEGAYGRMPTPEEAKYLASIPLLIAYLNGIGCYTNEDGQQIVTEIVGTRRGLFEVMGFPIAANDEGELPLSELVSPEFAELYTFVDAYEEGLKINTRRNRSSSKAGASKSKATAKQVSPKPQAEGANSAPQDVAPTNKAKAKKAAPMGKATAKQASPKPQAEGANSAPQDVAPTSKAKARKAAPKGKATGKLAERH